MDERLELRDWQDSLSVLDAVNLSGIVHSWHRVLSKIWNEARAAGCGTDYVNQHPICVLYSIKTIELSIGDYDYLSDDADKFWLAESYIKAVIKEPYRLNPDKFERLFYL